MPLVSRCAERETASSSTIVNQQLLQLMRGPCGPTDIAKALRISRMSVHRTLSLSA
jgi:transposase-like protein